jgi:hypothetical protein
MIAQIKNTYSKTWAKVYAIAAFSAVLWHHFFPAELVDTAEYIKTAFSWISKVQISDTPLAELRRSPLYPALSFLEFPFTDLPGIFSLRVIQLMASLYIPVLVYQILQVLNAEKQFNRILILLLSYPLQFYYTALELPDILAQLLLLIIFKQLFQRNNTGLTVAFIIGLKPIFFYLLILPVIQFVLNHERNWFKMMFPFFFFGGWIFFNLQKHQLPTYTSMGTTNSYYYNRKLLLHQVMNPEGVDSIYSVESEFIKKNIHVNRVVDSFMKSKTQESILKYPVHYAWIHFKGSFQTLIDPGRYDAMVFWNWPKSSGFLGVNDGNPQKQKRPIYEWVYMAIFALIGLLKIMLLVASTFLLSKKKPIDSATFIVLMAFGCYLLLLGPVGAARYLLPWYSIISIIVGLNAVELFKRGRKYENTSAQ